METEDSSSVPPPSLPEREEVSADDSRALLSTTAALAKEAASLFQLGSFQECLDVLNQLVYKKDDDPKVLHNIAVAEYFYNGCKDPQKLLDVLSKVKRKGEELGRAAGGEQLETGTSGSRGSSISSGGSGMIEPAGSNSDSTAYMDDHDTSVPTLNTAVILYHLQQYATALSVLEPLYQNIEPIDENTALRVCLLMLDITLASRQPRKAAGVLQYMEKAFCSGFLGSPNETGNSVTSAQAQSLADGTCVANVSTSSATPSCIPSPNAESSFIGTPSEEVLDEEALSLGLEIENSNAVRSVTVSSNVSRFPVERPSATLKLILHLYKVRLLLQTHNLKATKREVKLATSLTRGHDYLTALFLKAQLEYLRENYRKAIKLLTTSSSKEPGMTCLFLNNLGCIHHQLRKHHTAAVYFLKALHSSSSGTEKPAFRQDRSLAILYNAGMQQLSCGNPVLAFRCFQEAGRLYYNQPLLWLRLAECCLAALEKGLLEDSGTDLSGSKDELKVCFVGEGRWRKMLLPVGSLNPMATGLGLKLEDLEGDEVNSSMGVETEADFFVPGKPQQPSLVLARRFLLKALFLLDRRAAEPAAEAGTGADTDAEAESPEMKEDNGQGLRNSIVGDSKAGNGQSTAPQCISSGNGKENKSSSGTNIISSSVATYEEKRRKEDASIRQYVLVDMIYVELCLNNPLKALKIAETLLLQTDCTQTSQFLGHVYAAEALCMLNRPTAAANHLSACLTESTNVEIPGNGIDENLQKWKSGEHSEASGDGEDGIGGNSLVFGPSPEAPSLSSLTGLGARTSLYVNLAAIYAMQGDLSQAHHWSMQAVSVSPSNRSAILSVVYVELLQGKTQDAVTMLKQYRHLSCTMKNVKTRLSS